MATSELDTENGASSQVEHNEEYANNVLQGIYRRNC